MFWAIPSMTGDLRLTDAPSRPEDPERKEPYSVFVVENMTPDERERTQKFLTEMKGQDRLPKPGLLGMAHDWICPQNPMGLISETGRTEILIRGAVAELGPILASEVAPKVGALTAVRSVGGVLSVDVDPKAAVTKAKEPDAAVTTRKPTLCCPVPIEGPLVRSSTVLKAFCTPSQWASWMANGWLIAYGQISGHAYRIVHRHHPAARAQGKITWDLDDDNVIHCWDWSVPPAEEVLAIKLTLEHREAWIRNHSGALMGHRDKFRNPLGSDGLDGTDSARFLRHVGAFAEGFGLVSVGAKAAGLTA